MRAFWLVPSWSGYEVKLAVVVGRCVCVCGEVKPKEQYGYSLKHDSMQSRTQQTQTYQVFRVWPVPVSCVEAHLFSLVHLSTQLTTAWVCCTHLEQLMTSEGSQCYLIQSSTGNKENSKPLQIEIAQAGWKLCFWQLLIISHSHGKLSCICSGSKKPKRCVQNSRLCNVCSLWWASQSVLIFK